MFTSALLLALSGWFGSALPEAESPRWLSNYDQALEKGAQEKKPLAIFVGSGESGWEKLSREGKLGKDIKELLSNQYVCLYLDTTQPDAKKMAQTLEIPKGAGIVISDRKLEMQAFYHRGDLKGEDLEYYLKKFADPNLVVRTTETNPPERGSVQGSNSYYSPSFAPAAGRNC